MPPMEGMSAMHPPGSEAEAPADGETPCDHEASERCLAMAACALGASVPASPVRTEWASHAASVVPASGVAPASRTGSPEPPPPRA
jgi:hypothetical protein